MCVSGVVFLLLWKGEQDSEFSINFYFLFIRFAASFYPSKRFTVVLDTVKLSFPALKILKIRIF